MTVLRSNVIHQGVGQDQVDLRTGSVQSISGFFGVGLGEQFFKDPALPTWLSCTCPPCTPPNSEPVCGLVSQRPALPTQVLQ